MASTTEKRDWWYLYRCGQGVKRSEGFFGRHPVYEWGFTSEAVTALEEGHLRSGYKPASDGYIGSRRNCPAGIAGRTCTADGSGCSLHNYVIAYDIEYNYNRLSPRYPNLVNPWSSREIRLHKYTPDQVAAIEGITNKQGEQLWKWLGWVGDYMHWELDVPPERVSVEWNTMPGEDLKEEMVTFAEFSKMFRPEDVEKMSELGLLKPNEVSYWVGIVGKEPEDRETWENKELESDLYLAYKVRLPLYN